MWQVAMSTACGQDKIIHIIYTDNEKHGRIMLVLDENNNHLYNSTLKFMH